MQRNDWLDNMDKFLAFVKRKPASIKVSKPIKVAVIDDGINLLEKAHGDCISGGISFYTTPGSFLNRPFYFSSSGHGTLSMNIIRTTLYLLLLY
jgi:hypothetical protein